MKKRLLLALGLMLSSLATACTGENGTEAIQAGDSNLDVPGSAVKAHVQWIGYVDVKQSALETNTVNGEASKFWKWASTKMKVGTIPADQRPFAISTEKSVELTRDLIQDFRENKYYPTEPVTRFVYRIAKESILPKEELPDGMATTVYLVTYPVSTYEKVFWKSVTDAVKSECRGQTETEWRYWNDAQISKIRHQPDCDITGIANRIFDKQELRLNYPRAGSAPLLLLGTFTASQQTHCASEGNETSPLYPDLDSLFTAKTTTNAPLNLHFFPECLGRTRAIEVRPMQGL